MNSASGVVLVVFSLRCCFHCVTGLLFVATLRWVGAVRCGISKLSMVSENKPVVARKTSVVVVVVAYCDDSV